MSKTKLSGTATREAAAHLNRLGQDESLSMADRKTCLMASEWIGQVHELRDRLDLAEAFLNDELRRCETALARLSRRSPRPHEPLCGTELIAHLRRVRSELESAFPAAPTAIPFGATPA